MLDPLEELSTETVTEHDTNSVTPDDRVRAAPVAPMGAEKVCATPLRR